VGEQRRGGGIPHWDGACFAGAVAAQHFEGFARSWWQSNGDAIKTFPQLLMGLSVEFVGPNSFDLLVGDLRSRGMRSFSSFATFRSWFVQTVAAMRVFGAAKNRMWGDNVLVDSLVDYVLGTNYHEGVVIDPQTAARPTTLVCALEVLDERHRNLLSKLLAWGQVIASDGGPHKRRAEAVPFQAPHHKLSRHRQQVVPWAAPAALARQRPAAAAAVAAAVATPKAAGVVVAAAVAPMAVAAGVALQTAWTGLWTRDQVSTRYAVGQCVQCDGVGHSLSTCPRRSSN
jgi:hypothetical protein